MIYVVGNAPSSQEYRQSTFDEFEKWVLDQSEYQLDTETNVVDSIVERELKVVQFGDTTQDIQWVLQISSLNSIQVCRLWEILGDDSKLKLIQNATFEYTIFFKYGVELGNVYDTMLVEKIITTGWKVERGFYSLLEMVQRYLKITLDKGQQTEFGDDILTEEKVIYAAKDVMYLSKVRDKQMERVREFSLENVVKLENEAVLAYAEMEYFGMFLDKAAWLANVDLAQPLIDAAQVELNAMVNGELKDKAIEFNYLADKDTVTINWNSPKERQEVLQYLFPNLPGATKPIVTKYLKGLLTLPDATSDIHLAVWVLTQYLAKDWDALNKFMLSDCREWLISKEFLLEAGTVTINWNSPPQRLKLFQVVEPHLKGTDKESLADCDHPIIEAYQEYINATKLVSSFGEKFIEKYVDSDGAVRTRFDQILKTGRVSSSSPNLQNIPAKESVGTRYRNAFIAPPGWVFVDSDYSSQELVIIATFSKDPVWMEALEKGQDLHSVCAQLVFGQKWIDGADATCGYYALLPDGNIAKDKCKCKAHKTMRQACKTINFGLAYGMSKFKLSATLKITIEEAAQLIEDYFRAFPAIGGKLDMFGRFGVQNGYIMTAPPFKRIRWYDYWEERRDNDYWMGKVERASKNTPIQGTAADMMKLATIFIRRYIREHKLRDRVRLVAQVHDQQTCNVVEDYAEEWIPIMDELMRKAAKVIIPSGLLKAETTVSPVWTK